MGDALQHLQRHVRPDFCFKRVICPFRLWTQPVAGTGANSKPNQANSSKFCLCKCHFARLSGQKVRSHSLTLLRAPDSPAFSARAFSPLPVMRRAALGQPSTPLKTPASCQESRILSVAVKENGDRLQERAASLGDDELLQVRNLSDASGGP